jgi:hypothetical protein
MKNFFLSIVLLVITTIAYCQKDSTWIKWEWIMGDWHGEGSGQPGQGGGTFSFSPDLDNKILVRKSHSEYPATESKPFIIHNDLMVVYSDNSGALSKAIYFDNENHTINYSITGSDSSIVFTSDKIKNLPVFRLTYTLLENETINTKFEMSRDGENFMTYIEGKSKKVK